jgi:hypothetical protein
MQNLRLKSNSKDLTGTQPATIAERELLAFVTSVVNLFGSEQTKFLTDIWLDALAGMDRLPQPTSSEWQLVSLAASARLAIRLMGLENDERPNLNLLW